MSSSLRQATIQDLISKQTGKRTVEVQATTKESSDPAQVTKVTDALAKMAGVSPNEVVINSVGPSWGHDITVKAIRALIVFFIVIAVFVWFWFEPKMAVAALIAVFHDVILTIGIYSLSGFQVSPDTVIAFLTILGYSLYDTIVVFDKIAENTQNFASSGRLTYTELVNLSMNQVLARSINTTLVAVMPILSILVIGAWLLGATALNDFGLALFIGLTTGAYSSIFIASPILAVLKEREPYWTQVREKLGDRSGRLRFSPAAVAAEGLAAIGPTRAKPGRRPSSARRPSGGAPSRSGRSAVGRGDAGQPARPPTSLADESGSEEFVDGSGSDAEDFDWVDDDAIDETGVPLTGDATSSGNLGPSADDGRTGSDGGSGSDGVPAAAGGARTGGPASRPATGAPSTGSTNRPPPRPRKKGRRR